jgi:RNA polymerase sigma-70 factor, ECF subfamily
MDSCSTGLQELCDGASEVPAGFLVTNSRAGDILSVPERPTIFHEIYDRYADEVYRFAHWLTGNLDDARDITSETFVRVWTAPEEPRMDSVKAYLFTIARNLHRKQWRRRSRQVPLDEALHDRPDPAASPAQASATQDDLRRTLDAMQRLPELERTVLLLRAQGELSYEEIAAVTGLTALAAKVRVFRARAKLSTMLRTKTGENL